MAIDEWVNFYGIKSNKKKPITPLDLEKAELMQQFETNRREIIRLKGEIQFLEWESAVSNPANFN